MNRRHFLTLGVTVFLSGCARFGDNEGSKAPTADSSAATTAVTTSAPTETTHEDELTSIPPTETWSLSEDPELESILPPARDGWQLIETSIFDYSYLDGKDAREGIYEANDGTTYHVVVFEAKEGDVDIKASQFKCAGWPVLAVRENYIVAAGTGTYAVTLTPRHPQTLADTPIPGTTDRTRDLILWSPYFDSSHIVTEEIECNRVTSSETE